MEQQDNLNHVMQEEELKEVAGGVKLPLVMHWWCEICGWSLKTNPIPKEAVKARHDSETIMPGCKGDLRSEGTRIVAYTNLYS